MKLLRQALLRATQHPLAARIAAAAVPAAPLATPNPRERYEQDLLRALARGMGNLHPVSFPAWRGGRPALARQQPCRVRGGLSDGQTEMVVVRYDHPQPLAGTTETTQLGIEFLHDLAPCPCGGYLHPRACAPRPSREKETTK